MDHNICKSNDHKSHLLNNFFKSNIHKLSLLTNKSEVTFVNQKMMESFFSINNIWQVMIGNKMSKIVLWQNLDKSYGIVQVAVLYYFRLSDYQHLQTF